MEDKRLEKDIATVESQRLEAQAKKIAAMNSAMQSLAHKANDESDAEIIMTTNADRNPFATAEEVQEARDAAVTMAETEAAAAIITESNTSDASTEVTTITATEVEDDTSKITTLPDKLHPVVADSELKPKILEQAPLSDEEDAKQNKKFAWLAYILFFIPLCINSESPFVRLHVNEGLEVFLFDVLAVAMLLCGTLIKWGQNLAIIGYLLILAGIGLLILTTVTKIFQIVQVARGKKNQTPWFWKWRMIK